MQSITTQIKIIRDFIPNQQTLYDELVANTVWDLNMRSRKTACYGEPYDYSEQKYDFRPMSDKMKNIAELVKMALTHF